jgi:hypothetical protein
MVKLTYARKDPKGTELSPRLPKAQDHRKLGNDTQMVYDSFSPFHTRCHTMTSSEHEKIAFVAYPAISFPAANQDDKELEELGYVPSFKREFTNLATISFAFSILVSWVIYFDPQFDDEIKCRVYVQASRSRSIRLSFSEDRLP